MPLTRSTPLRRTPLARGGALKRTRMRVYRPAVANAEARNLVAARAEGKCEAGLFGCADWGTDVHHRITKKAGGRKGAAAVVHDRASNTLLLCRPCHGWVTDNPLSAYDLGLCLKEHHVTELEPLSYRGEFWAVLGDDGSVVGFP